MDYFYLLLILLNVFSFFLYGADKRRARKNRWRISEKALLLSALGLGALGALLGMYIFRHKTRKPLFKIGVPCILILQGAVLIKLFWL